MMVNKYNYTIYMNNKYNTIAIIPQPNFANKVTDCMVGFEPDVQLVNYTLNDKMNKWKKEVKKYKEKVEVNTEKVNKIEEKIEELWYVPNMPGYIKSKKNYNEIFIKEEFK
jgi:hypothetical protein